MGEKDLHLRCPQMLASDPGVPLLRGANYVSGVKITNFTLRLDPDRPGLILQVQAHTSSFYGGAFEMPDWNPHSMLPAFELAGTRAGATTNHDACPGLLQRHLARGGARTWPNPSS